MQFISGETVQKVIILIQYNLKHGIIIVSKRKVNGIETHTREQQGADNITA